ncbi:MAG: hypothetical protein ACFE9L_18695, partial [Candidatus Hodarchaeota archaeon]
MSPPIQNINQNHVLSHITILFLICNILSLNSFLLTTDLNQPNDTSIDLEELLLVTRLMKESDPLYSSLYKNNTDKNLKKLDPPSYLIGNQRGKGGGIIQIHDSLIKINSSSLEIQNTMPLTLPNGGTPSGHNTTFTIDYSLENFSKNSADFQILNVTAKEDWRSIENETGGQLDLRDSRSFLEVAQKIEIKEDYANITQVRVYITYVDIPESLGGLDGDYPHGNVSIYDD